MTEHTSLRLSVLDLSPVPSGSSSAQALRNTLALAQLADRLGYTRYWLSEHHNSQLLASAAPEVLIGHVASVTSRIRVGSGGVMLPNHAPLKVAETFRLLEALHPQRVDLGIGRAPGTDLLTALALRRSREALTAEDFPKQLAELLAFFSSEEPGARPFHQITAIPADVETPAIWLLGSSTYSARLAGVLGLGFAFAHHINPGPAVDALRIYREQFQPSTYLSAPQALLATSVICADTDAQSEELASSADLTLLRLHQGKPPSRLPSPAEARAYPYTPDERALVLANRERVIVGPPAIASAQLRRLAEQTGVDEVMVNTMVHDHAARERSYTLLAESLLGG